MVGLRTAQVRQLMVTTDLAGTTLCTLPHQSTLLTQEQAICLAATVTLRSVGILSM